MAVAYQSSTKVTWSSGDGTIAKPAGTVDGDLILVAVGGDLNASENHTYSMAADGFSVLCTLTRSSASAAGTDLTVFWKIASSEPASWTIDIDSNNLSQAVAVRIDGHDGSDPFDITDIVGYDNSTEAKIPSVVTTVANTLVIGFVTWDESKSLTTVPTGWTQIQHADTSGADLHAIYKAYAATGATGVGQYDISSATRHVGATIAIQPPQGGSASSSISPSPSVSVSLSPSPSPSSSVSPSPSASVSPSSSISPSPSVSVSLSESPSPSSSVSPSSSISLSESPSPSISVSLSVSSSVSPSSSISLSPSLSQSSSVSLSISLSPSEGFADYTRGNYNALPSDDTDLEINYSEQDLLDVSSKNNVRVDQVATQEFMVHQFKDFVGANSSCQLEWEGQTTLSPASSTVYLQIYNRDLNEWETVDSDNTTAANTDFILLSLIADLTDYKDASNVISCRVYQEAL